ncbi:MAG: glycosyltransferase, partial [Candidatus Thermoplasmatota archaeon]|nr:glycosyltransferase [Candidatus Thermoplasmatota archaeon]
MLGRLIDYIHRLFLGRKKAYLKKIAKDTYPIHGQLPKGMSIPSIRGKGNDYTFIEELKDNFVGSKEPYSLGVSIIVPVYNRKEILTKTLAGILNQTYPQALIETVIADDGSSDGVEELIPEYEKVMNIKYVKQEDKGYRLSAVRNLGIKAASHNFVVILDCDMLPYPELVESYMQYLHVTSEAVLIGYRRFVCTDELSADEIRKDIELALNLPDIITNNPVITKRGSRGPTKDWREEIYAETNLLKDLDFPFRVFCGGNVAFSKSIFVRTGYFDEDFQHWGGEDMEMGFRIYNSGYYFIPVKGATALHQEPEGGENSVDREGGRALTNELLVDKCPAAH